MSFLLGLAFVTLPPVTIGLFTWGLLKLIGHSQKRAIMWGTILLLLCLAGEGWLYRSLHTPTTPELTKEQAKRILLWRPEFTANGTKPIFQQLNRATDSMRDYFYDGFFSFDRGGKRVTNAQAVFRFMDKQWALDGFRWESDGDILYVHRGIPTPVKQSEAIRQALRPGVSWRRLPDGTYGRFETGPTAKE